MKVKHGEYKAKLHSQSKIPYRKRTRLDKQNSKQKNTSGLTELEKITVTLAFTFL